MSILISISSDRGDLLGWQRQQNCLAEIETMQGWVSPLLDIHFEIKHKELIIYRPDGQPFQTYVELFQSRSELKTKTEKLAAKLRELGIDPNTV